MKDNEVYLGLTGGFIGGGFWWGKGNWPSEGMPCSVDFDYQAIYDREDSHGDVVGFYHTHPHFIGMPSSVDYQTMHGWTLSLGRPLVCLIEGIDGLNAHWFIDDENQPIQTWVRRWGDYFIGRVPSSCRKKNA